MTEALSSVAWDAPWLAPLAQRGRAVTARVQAGADFRQEFSGAGGQSFVAPASLPAGEAYEAFIARTGSVPTRDNLHDFFNGLIWLHYPLAKRQLNRLQAADISARGVQSLRGPLRDACTLFDENGAVLQAPDALWQALMARDWQALFVTHRGLWQQATLTVFGHAALEQLVRPRKGITVHVLTKPCGVPLDLDAQRKNAPENVACLDRWLSDSLDSNFMRTKPFTPLPLLGVPGWCPENEALCFYDDPAVFRPARNRASS